MSVVKINAVSVPEDMRETFMERFAQRAGSVEAQEGFEEFMLLRPADDGDRFFVLTRGASEDAFAAWMKSRDFAAAHGPEGGEARGPAGVTAELMAFEVVERVVGPA